MPSPTHPARRLVLLGVIVVAGVGLVAIPAHARTTRFTCRQSRTRTLAATKTIRVYEQGRDRDAADPVYGCVYGSHHKVMVGVFEMEFGVTNVTIAGHDVALFEQYAGREGADAEMQVRDLRTGRLLHREQTGQTGESSGNGYGDSIVLKPNGSVAWITDLDSFDGSRLLSRAVHVADAGGSRIVDEAASIDPRSLALAGSTVYWTDGGQPRAARL